MLYFFVHVTSSSILIPSHEFFGQVVFGLIATHTELKFETKTQKTYLPMMRDIQVCVC